MYTTNDSWPKRWRSLCLGLLLLSCSEGATNPSLNTTNNAVTTNTSSGGASNTSGSSAETTVGTVGTITGTAATTTGGGATTTSLGGFGGGSTGGSTTTAGTDLGAGGTSAASVGGSTASGNATTAGTDGAGAGGTAGTSSGPTLPPVDDYSEAGPFDTLMEENVGPGGNYTVYRPDPLGTDGFLHAPIIFGPGIGQSVTVHTEMLTHFASHGFVVVGANLLSGGPGDAGNRMTMLDGLDWILGENETTGIYEGKLYVTHAVSMGFSVGGTAAVEIGGHDAVETVVSIHGHTASAELHGTMLQTTGTNDTVGLPLQEQTYAMSEVQTFLATLTGAPHQYIEQNAGGEQRPAIVAWMRYFIYGDTGASRYFYGDDCVMCVAPWENPQRKNWE